MIRAFAMLALLWALAPTPAKAETTECTQITAVPATISKQGVYCLKADLATNISSGNAITIATNNVTLDCNGFKLGGLGAGLTTRAHGVYAEERMNITIRNCAIRGFHRGIVLTGTTLSSGHRVHDNLLDGTTYLGIRINGDSSHIRDNRVVNTGGADDANGTYSAILMTGSGGLIANNDVNRVTSLAAPQEASSSSASTTWWSTTASPG